MWNKELIISAEKVKRKTLRSNFSYDLLETECWDRISGFLVLKQHCLYLPGVKSQNAI